MSHDHKLWDVWEDGNRAPLNTEVTKEEAEEVVAEAPLKRYKMCTECGINPDNA